MRLGASVSELKFEHVKSAIDRINMTENCKHPDEDIHRQMHDALVYHCAKCGKYLIPNWTVKPEPIKLEFEATVFKSYGDDHFYFSREIGQECFLKLVESGKRFKITAEEICD